ncbi:iron uptake porin [Oscillatoriales cyanobacterium LEGE 11467]|uniref:Iron uptake porin n=1 Tax=Zarconia navalis LEGE 11467 TaxID=1828826 RepID=A0A928VYN0_9CYAN|nr:iron uptake porin [Zarconia navalis LEGE 11467]
MPKVDGAPHLIQRNQNAKSIEIVSGTETFKPIDRLSQIPSVDRLSDIEFEPTDWAYQALQSLSNRYGCIAGFPDGTYRGVQSLTRYEFAAGLNACLDRLNELLSQSGGSISSEDLAIVERLREEFAAELATLPSRIDTLEARTAELEANQFSTTTKLTVINSVAVVGRTSNEADLFPRDGTPETGDPGTNISLQNLNYFIFNTQFSDRSLLRLALLNFDGLTGSRLTNDVRLGNDFFGDTNGLRINDLNYRFLIGDKFAGIVGTANVNATSAFRGPNRIEGAATGPLSFFAQRNPILNIGLGAGGLGFDWQFADRASLQAVYSTNIPGFFVSSDGPKGHNTTAVQLALTPIDPVDLTVYYVNDYSPDGGLVSFVGDAQLTVVDRLTDESEPLQTNAVGATLNWQVSPSLSVGGWFGYTNSRIPDRSGNVQTTNYMVFLNLLDLFGEGNLGGLYVGQPPKIISSDLPEGNNIPDFFNTGRGRSGGQPGTTTHVELFYRWQLDDNISITPGAIVIFNPGHTPDSDTIGIGILRTTFIF